LQIFAAKSGFSKSVAVASLEDLETFKDGVRYKHVQEHHFDSTVKRMSVVYHDLEHQTNIAFMKGAPERVLDACLYNSQGDILTVEGKADVLRLMDRFASEGLVNSLGVFLIKACSSTRIQNVKRRQFGSRSSRK
jgi:magnesium-transporting ATPase (P-type)